MHLLAPVRDWLESLLGFIGLEAQTLTDVIKLTAFTYNPISWLPLLEAITPILINTANLLISSQSHIHYKGIKQITGRSKRQEVQVLWVHWFELDPTHKGGFSHLCIPWLQFIEPSTTTEWYSFISPSDVLCTTHTISAFAWDHVDPQPCPEGSHAVQYLEEDWNYYYVDM